MKDFPMRTALSLVLCVALIIPWAADAATLRVITDDNYPPYLFRNPDGRVQGYLVDRWALFEKKKPASGSN